MIAIPRLRTIRNLALPMIGATISVPLMSLIDTAMVGSLGEGALAAVGTGGFAYILLTAPLLGIGTAVQALVSRRKGENKTDILASPLNAGITMAIILGLPLILLGYFLIPLGFPLINSDAKVIQEGVPYMQVLIFGAIGMGLNLAFRGFWNGIGKPIYYMATLITLQLFNVALNYAFIFGHFGAPELGAKGAGIASVIAIYLGTCIYMVLGFLVARPMGFLTQLPTSNQMAGIFRFATPTGIQEFFVMIGYLVFLWIIGKIGTLETAILVVLIRIMQLGVLPAMGLGMAGGVLAGQAMGRQQPKDAARWGWDVFKIGFISLTAFGLVIAFFPGSFLQIFLNEDHAILVGTWPLIIMGLNAGFIGGEIILLQVLIGVGDAKRAMFFMIAFHWGIFLPTAYGLAMMGYGFLPIWFASNIISMVRALCFLHLWSRGRWQTIQV